MAIKDCIGSLAERTSANWSLFPIWFNLSYFYLPIDGYTFSHVNARNGAHLIQWKFQALQHRGIPYTRKFSRYEIFAEQEANRIFAIIFSRITGRSWKGSTCYVLLQISNCCKLANFHGLNFRWSIDDREIREIYIPWKFPRIRYMLCKNKAFATSTIATDW